MRKQQPTTEQYPPSAWESAGEFVAPGPVSRPLATYLAMCAPRVRRVARDKVGAGAESTI